MARWGEIDLNRCWACGERVMSGVVHTCRPTAQFWTTCPRCGETHALNEMHACPRPSDKAQVEAVRDHYALLDHALAKAREQAAEGKGAERHGQGQPFERQPMMEIGRMVGVGFCLGQAMKKTQEASRMEPEAAKRELLGAINYLAGAYLLLEEKGQV